MSIVVTSPHASCPKNTDQRMCDLAAALAGKLFSELTQQSGIPTIYLEGDELRHNHDLNRNPSRNTKFRRRLQKVLESTDDTELLIDMHSFPNYRIEEAGDINFFENGEHPPDIVLLRGPLDSYQHSRKKISLCNILYECLSHKTNVNCKIIEGITVNDIMNNASEYKIPGVLIEVNEKYIQDPDKLYPIFKRLVLKLKSILENKQFKG